MRITLQVTLRVRVSARVMLVATYYHSKVPLKISHPIISILHLKQNQGTCMGPVPILAANHIFRFGTKRRARPRMIPGSIKNMASAKVRVCAFSWAHSPSSAPPPPRPLFPYPAAGAWEPRQGCPSDLRSRARGRGRRALVGSLDSSCRERARL